jgi:hypothetical protein
MKVTFPSVSREDNDEFAEWVTKDPKPAADVFGADFK